jgi:hypothetical protein
MTTKFHISRYALAGRHEARKPWSRLSSLPAGFRACPTQSIFKAATPEVRP